MVTGSTAKNVQLSGAQNPSKIMQAGMGFWVWPSNNLYVEQWAVHGRDIGISNIFKLLVLTMLKSSVT